MKNSWKQSLLTWTLMAVMSVLLWYRNVDYDRLWAIIVFTFGLANLILYGVFSGLQPSQGGRLLFVTLWLQVFLLSLGVWVYFSNWFTQIVALFFALVLVISIIYAFSGSSDLTAEFNQNDQVDLRQGQENLLGQWFWLYAIGLTLPFLILLYKSDWRAINLYILLGYLLLSALIVYLVKPENFAGTWLSLTIIFAFLAWTVGSASHGS